MINTGQAAETAVTCEDARWPHDNSTLEQALFISDELIEGRYCYPAEINHYYVFYVAAGTTGQIDFYSDDDVGFKLFTDATVDSPSSFGPDDSVPLLPGNEGRLVYVQVELGGESDLYYEIDLIDNLSCPTNQPTILTFEDWKEGIACFNRLSSTGTHTMTVRSDITTWGTSGFPIVNKNADTKLVIVGDQNENDISRKFSLDAGEGVGTTFVEVGSNTVVELHNLILMNSAAPEVGTDVEKSGGALRNFGVLILNDIYVLNSKGLNGGAIFNGAGAHLVMNEIFLRDNSAVDGGAIYNLGSAILNDSTVYYNSADVFGGAVHNESFFTATRTHFLGNQALVGGVFNNKGALYVNSSALRGNTAFQNGGGILNQGGMYLFDTIFEGNNSTSESGGGIFSQSEVLSSIANSSFMANSAKVDGGGLFNNNSANGSILISNSSFIGNSSEDDGGGIDNRGPLFLSHVTIAQNFAPDKGAGIYNKDGSTVFTNSLVADNGSDCVNNGGSITLNGHNLIGDNSCGATGGTNPLFNPRNGLTYLSFEPQSVVNNTADPAHCPETDQLGQLRQLQCDLGAYELRDSIDTPTVDLIPAEVIVSEDVGVAEFQVSLSVSTTVPVTVNFSPTAGTATAGDDYVDVQNGSIVIPAGDTIGILPITIVDDAQIEESETFSITISLPAESVGELGDNQTAVATILDNDSNTPPPVSPEVSIEAAKDVIEGSGAAELSVSLSQTTTVPVKVNYLIGIGTATATADYIDTGDGSITIPAGASSGTISIQIVDDSEVEEDELFPVTLSLPTGSVATLGTNTVAVVKIVDNDGTNPPTTGQRLIFLPLIRR